MREEDLAHICSVFRTWREGREGGREGGREE